MGNKYYDVDREHGSPNWATSDIHRGACAGLDGVISGLSFEGIKAAGRLFLFKLEQRFPKLYSNLRLPVQYS